MTDVLDLLRAADPERATTPPPADPALRDRITARPAGRPSRRPALRVPRPALALAAVCAVAAFVAGVSGGAGDGAPLDLAGRAYAQTASADAVLHSVEVTRSPVRLSDESTQPSHTRVERWVHGSRAHIVVRTGPPGAQETYDQVLGADGVLRNLLPSGEIRELRPSDGGETKEILRQSGMNAVALFRERYRAGELDDAGTTTFAGRPAREYVRERRDGGPQGRQLVRESFFVDEQTAEPIGMRTTGENPETSFTTETVLELFERLPPTPENLARLER